MDRHGGDVYRNRVDLDFSVSVNPLGTPESVKAAMRRAVELCARYPDPKAEALKRAVAGMLAAPEEYLLFGNGASELFMAAAHGLKPKKTVIPVPSFYGYEYAAEAAGSEIIYYSRKRGGRFGLEEDIYDVLTEDVDLLFLANPNNPDGNLLGKEAAADILRHCSKRGIFVILDECFIEFSGNRFSMLSEIGSFENLMLVRAFTKIFAVPGVRLGYALCKNPAARAKTAGQLPEWNLSCFAQEAGLACAEQTGFMTETENYVRKERQYFEERCRRKGIWTFPSSANFILLYSRAPLYERLLEKRILIRDCAGFRGLGRGFYRIAVKSRKENDSLLENL